MPDQLLYRHFLDHFADAFFLNDDCGQLLDVNMQACESLGFNRDELLLKVQNFSKNYDEQALIALWKLVNPGVNTVVKNHHTRKNGTIYPVEVKIAWALLLALVAKNLRSSCTAIPSHRRLSNSSANAWSSWTSPERQRT
ncbi:PAS domain S-box protein [Comamonas sp. 26]|uniref:PAS domain S-box protein n=1 Tax=Comamonas sp. 26 TaxID=2035201 RepID=UPI000C1A4956|nr:PAS domain S-box protein [Comamonas sp. 26]